MASDDVTRQLIDSYRMRAEDDYNLAGDGHCLYVGEHPRPKCARVLDLAEKRKFLLPGWQNRESRTACEAMGAASSKGSWADLCCVMEKDDI
ncbi:MAG: hypothetical protein Q9207_003237 [Kuettlingeria erythrocarpa]